MEWIQEELHEQTTWLVEIVRPRIQQEKGWTMFSVALGFGSVILYIVFRGPFSILIAYCSSAASERHVQEVFVLTLLSMLGVSIVRYFVANYMTFRIPDHLNSESSNLLPIEPQDRRVFKKDTLRACNAVEYILRRSEELFDHRITRNNSPKQTSFSRDLSIPKLQIDQVTQTQAAPEAQAAANNDLGTILPPLRRRGGTSPMVLRDIPRVDYTKYYNFRSYTSLARK